MPIREDTMTSKVEAGLVPVGEAAVMLGVDRRTLLRWRAEGHGPANAEIGGRVYYSEDAISQWLYENDDPSSVDQRLAEGFGLNYDGDLADVSRVEHDECGY